MNKIISLLLLFVLVMSVSFSVYATEAEQTTTEPEEETTTSVTVTDPTDPTEPTDPTDPTNPTDPEEPEEPAGIIEDVVPLDGKTILIVGNSMVYYGNCVLLGDQGKADHGYFYQLIASNGEEATVIDHTYPGKKLEYIYENYLVKLDPEECAKVDYLVLSEGNQYNDNLVGTCEKIMDLFPNIIGFRFLRQPNMFDVDDEDLYLPVLIEQVEKLKEAGYEVVDWGKLVRDIFTGETEVPGATLPFERTTFLKENKGYKNAVGTAVSQGISGDRNHQNPLSGYITAQMLYTSLTNRSAVFSDYSFCGDKSISIYMDLPEFARVHYTGEKKTNFCEIFASAQDMLGLQKLIDIYVAKEGRHPLTVGKSCTSSGVIEDNFCSLCGKVAGIDKVLESLGEHELVFVKGKAETCTEDGLTDSITCKKCEAVLKPHKVTAARVHSGLTESAAATTTKDGFIKSICKYCDAELSNQTIKSVKSVTLSQSEYIYDGTEKKPSVTVIDADDKALAEGVDYTVGYEAGRIQSGKYTVKVTFKGNYSGVQRCYFTIKPKAVETVTVESTVNSITLNWAAAEGASYYRIYKLDEKTNAYEYYDSATEGTSFTATGLSSGTKYTFAVRGVIKDDGTILSDYSPECVTSTRPAVVKEISVTQNTTAIKLSWKPVKGATAYRIYRYDALTQSYVSIAYIKNNTSYTHKKLSAGTVYKFKIRAYTDIDCGKFIGGLSEEFATSTKPSTVSEITATQTENAINLSWKSVNGATAYRIYCYDTVTKSYKNVAYIENVTAYKVEKLSSGTAYKFKIRAYTDIDCGKFIGGLSEEFVTSTKPSAVTKITATQTDSSITLSWEPVKGATAYRVSISSEKGMQTATYDVKTASCEFDSLSSGVVYKFSIVPYIVFENSEITGAASKEFATSTKPSAVTKITATQTDSSINLSWQSVNGATAYRIYKNNSKTKAYKSVAYVTDGTSYEVKKLSAGTVYKFKIRAYSDIDCGKFIGELSDELRTSTKPDVTKKITATQTTDSIKLKWKAVKGATAYRIYKYNSKTKTYKSIAYVTDGRSYELKKLSAGKTYKFKIRAYADIDCGKFIGSQSEEFITSTKPKTPSVKAVSSSKGKVTLTWKDVGGETKYQIYYSRKGSGSYKLYSELDANSKKATVTSLKSGKTYNFRVRACRTNGGGTVKGGYKTVSVKVK